MGVCFLNKGEHPFCLNFLIVIKPSIFGLYVSPMIYICGGAAGFFGWGCTLFFLWIKPFYTNPAVISTHSTQFYCD